MMPSDQTRVIAPKFILVVPERTPTPMSWKASSTRCGRATMPTNMAKCFRYRKKLRSSNSPKLMGRNEVVISPVLSITANREENNTDSGFFDYFLGDEYGNARPGEWANALVCWFRTAFIV